MAKTLLKRGFYVKKAGAKIPTFMFIDHETLSRQQMIFVHFLNYEMKFGFTDFCSTTTLYTYFT